MKTLYLWGRKLLTRLEVFDGREDIEKKPELPSGGPFAKLHQSILKRRAKRKSWKR